MGLLTGRGRLPVKGRDLLRTQPSNINHRPAYHFLKGEFESIPDLLGEIGPKSKGLNKCYAIAASLLLNNMEKTISITDKLAPKPGDYLLLNSIAALVHIINAGGTSRAGCVAPKESGYGPGSRKIIGKRNK